MSGYTFTGSVDKFLSQLSTHCILQTANVYSVLYLWRQEWHTVSFTSAWWLCLQKISYLHNILKLGNLYSSAKFQMKFYEVWKSTATFSSSQITGVQWTEKEKVTSPRSLQFPSCRQHPVIRYQFESCRQMLEHAFLSSLLQEHVVAPHCGRVYSAYFGINSGKPWYSGSPVNSWGFPCIPVTLHRDSALYLHQQAQHLYLL